MSENELSAIRRNFSENTSCHGVSQIYSSKSKYEKVFWCFLVVAVLGMLVSQVTIRIQAYLARETTTSIVEQYNATLEMPAITICNFNRFFYADTQEEMEAIKELAKAEVYPYVGIDYDKLEYFNNMYNGSIREYAIVKGWNLSESLYWCRMGNEECTADDFIYTIGNMGKCWTFKTDRWVEKAGSKSGLYMILDSRQDGYTETPEYGNWGAGIKVQVHSPTSVPEVDEFGLAIPVGFTAFVTVKMIQENIMYEPWGRCQPDKENLNYYQTYSHANCFRECHREFIEESCECVLYHFQNSTDFPECTPAETISCLYNVSLFRELFLTPENCECQPPCNTRRHESKISYGSFPNAAVYYNSPITFWENATKEEVSQNLVGLHVYYESLSYVERREDKKITWSALLSDVGGQLGLWLGISVVTIVDIAHFFANHFRILMRKVKELRGHQKTTNQDVEEK